MTDERIDIEITDKVSPKVADKIRAIAMAAREAESSITELKRHIASIDSSSIDKLANASAKVTSAQARQVSATARLTNAQTRQETVSVKTAIAQQRIATESAKTAAAQSKAAVAASRAATAATQQEIAVSRLAAAKVREAAALDTATQAQRINNRIRQQGNRSQAQSLYQTQNLIYQLNDIVVGLASGQKPATVLIQQGSQISTIYGPGKGVLGTMRLLGASLATIFVPLLPVIATVAALGLGFAALTHEIRLSSNQAISFGDVFKATFQVAYRNIKDLFLPAVKSISPVFIAAYEIIKTATINIINTFIGVWSFAYRVVTKLFTSFPSVMKDIFVIAINSILEVVTSMVNGIISGLNQVIELANQASEAVGGVKLLEGVEDVDLSSFKLKVTGAAADAGRIIGEEAKRALNTDFVGSFFDEVKVQAEKNSQKRILKSGTAKDVTALDKQLPEFQQQGELDEIKRTQAERLELIRKAEKEHVLTRQEAASRIVAINADMNRQIMAANAAQQSIALTSASSTFDSLATIAEGFAGKQSGIYQAMFIASKAFAIADSIIKIQQGIANALSLPFPANIAAVAGVAAAAANIVSSIQAVQFSAQGKKDGGMVYGPGGPREDKVPAWLSNGEFVVNAAATRRNRPLLEAINDNNVSPYRDGGLVKVPSQMQAAPQPSIGGKRQRQANGNGPVTINVYAQDAQSFMASRNQIASKMARTVNEGHRNL